jgi:hypothetical protein
LVAACPLKGLVGRPSSVKKAALQVHLLFSQHRGESWQAGKVQEIPQSELVSQQSVHQDVKESGDFPLYAAHQSQASGVPIQ